MISATVKAVAGLLLGAMLVISFSSLASIDTYEFSDESLRERYLTLAAELRCPKCQNQNIADSNAPISEDLRAELYRLLNEGYSDEQIIEHMVARYGDFVRYRPPLDSKTVLLWAAPVLFLLLGSVILIYTVVRGRRSNAPTTLSAEEQAKLDKLLGDNDSALEPSNNER